MKYPKTPEHEKLLAARDKSQAIGEFVEWLQGKGVTLCGPKHEHSEKCFTNESDFPTCGYYKGERPIYHFDVQKELAEFFEIDLNKLEEEKMALLAYIRAHG